LRGINRRISEFDASWSIEFIPGQPGIHRETLSQKIKTKTNKQTKNPTVLCDSDFLTS
jgi:hypothetical protein